MLELLRADEWLLTRLGEDPALKTHASGGVHLEIAQFGATWPQLIVANLSAVDILGVGAARIMVSALYLVKVVDKLGKQQPYPAHSVVDSKAAKAIDRADELLHAASGTTVDGRILSCVREETVRYDEEQRGVIYRHVGGRFRLHAQPL